MRTKLKGKLLSQICAYSLSIRLINRCFSNIYKDSINLTSENIYSRKSVGFLCLRIFSFATLVLSAASQVQAENSLTGLWLDQTNGIQVRIIQDGDKVTIWSPGPFFSEGIEILKAGEIHFQGSIEGSTIEGTSWLFKTRSVHQRCGGPLLEQRRASIKISGDSNSLYGRMAGKTFYSNCSWSETEAPFQYKRLSRTETTSACPKAIPPEDGYADSNDYTGAVFISTVMGAISGPPTPATAVLSVGKIFSTLKGQLGILNARSTPALLIGYINSLSSERNITTDRAQTLLSGHKELSERLAASRMCVEAGKGGGYYELNFYQVTEAECKAITGAGNSLPPIHLNGQNGGTCNSDSMLSGNKIWENTPGTNQITFMANKFKEY